MVSLSTSFSLGKDETGWAFPYGCSALCCDVGCGLLGDESENKMDIKSVNTIAVTSVPLKSADAFRATSVAAVAETVLLDDMVAPSQQNAVAAPKTAQEVEQNLNESVQSINQAFKSINSSVRFSIDDDTQRQIVKVIDADTDKVIRQFPSEEVLAIAKALDKLQGLLIKDKA